MLPVIDSTSRLAVHTSNLVFSSSAFLVVSSILYASPMLNPFVQQVHLASARNQAQDQIWKSFILNCV